MTEAEWLLLFLKYPVMFVDVCECVLVHVHSPERSRMDIYVFHAQA